MSKKSLTKTKGLIRQHGEVFTPSKVVNDMLKMLPANGTKNVWQIESPIRFLEQACGDGAFLTEIYNRKLKNIKSESQYEWEFMAALQTSSIYGIELSESHAEQCMTNMHRTFMDFYAKRFPKTQNEDTIGTIKFLISRNIIRGNALTFRRCSASCGNVCNICEEIIFSEWTPKVENGDFMFIRKDYTYEALVKAEIFRKDIQNTLFAEMEKDKEYGLKKEYSPVFWNEIRNFGT